MKTKMKVSETVINEKTTMEKEWKEWWNTVKPDVYEEIQLIETKKAFFSGAATMGFIMTILAEKKDKNKAGQIVDRLMEEIKDFFEHEIKELHKHLKKNINKHLKKNIK